MRSSGDLRRAVRSMDRRGYPVLKDVRGQYDFGDLALSIDHVQGDPFAAPSALSLRVPAAVGAFPRELYDLPHRRIALEDRLARSFAAALGRRSHKVGGSGKSGFLGTGRPGPEVLRRSAIQVEDDGGIVARLVAGFPAHGRSVDAAALETMLLDLVPRCAREALRWESLRGEDVRAAVDLSDDQRYVRDALEGLGLVAFVADGAVLPRASGVSSRPMVGAVPFASPDGLRVELDLPHRGPTSGMGVPKGVTCIVGGGYHGKTTLLKAIEAGVYDHVLGDGREYVVTDAAAVKLRAEDGRAVHGADVSLFIGDLPNRQDTRRFSTENASGSTSQAAGTVEAIETGSRLLLIDEDTSATNFMVRDALMAEVVARDREPITPYVERVRDLYERSGVSSIVVAGSSGAFFHVADTVVQMDCYRAQEITGRAKAACAARPESRIGRAPGYALPGPERFLGLGEAEGDERGRGRPGASGGRGGARGRGGRDRLKVRVAGTDGVEVGPVSADLRLVEQIVDPEQVATLAACVRVCLEEGLLETCTVAEATDWLLERLSAGGFDAVAEHGRAGCGMAMPRRQEIAACLNRLRAAR